MGLFRKKVRSDYELVYDKSGAVVGLWLANPHHAHERMLIGALLLKHDLGHLMDADHRLKPNDVDGNGGMFVLFEDDRLDGERDPQAMATSAEEAASFDLPADHTLTINGRDYPVREDFETFSRDALMGNIALLETSIADASWTDHTRRLHQALAAAFGADAQRTRAAVHTSLCCLTCMHEYPGHALMLRDAVREGGSVGGTSADPAAAERVRQVLTMTACVHCGGQNAAWIYVPSRHASG
ncbi:MAG: hypothetical protein ACRDNL_07865 [Spirillospora sp.]